MEFFCMTCGNPLPQHFFHTASHKIVPFPESDDPIVFNPIDHKWYFWYADEALCISDPFDTEKAARAAFARYIRRLSEYSS